MDVVDALVVEAVLESRAECADADRARAALSEALSAARAPTRGGARLRGAPATSNVQASAARHWTVTMTVTSTASSSSSAPKSVDAVILDDNGSIVAQRTLTDRSARLCVPLARAVGAWASLVLDAELARAKDDDSAPPLSALSGQAGQTSFPPPTLGVGADRRPRDATSSNEGEPASVERRSIELGTMVYLRNGMTPTGGFVGVSPFITIELSTGWVLRPSLAFGRSSAALPIAASEASQMSHLGVRTDFCRRIPGNYIERRGIEADLCAGVEAGVLTADKPFAANTPRPRGGVGPSLNLRGELAAGMALEVRGHFGANLVNAPVYQEGPAPPVFAAAELGVSVRLP